MEVRFDINRIAEAKWERNSGRTVDALHQAILKTKDHASVVFVLGYESERRHIGDLVKLICEHYGYTPTKNRGGYDIDGSSLHVVTASRDLGRGCRAHYVIDHSVKEALCQESLESLLAAVAVAHVE